MLYCSFRDNTHYFQCKDRKNVIIQVLFWINAVTLDGKQYIGVCIHKQQMATKKVVSGDV